MRGVWVCNGGGWEVLQGSCPWQVLKCLAGRNRSLPVNGLGKTLHPDAVVINSTLLTGRRLVESQDAQKMAVLLAYLFDADSLKDTVREDWLKAYDKQVFRGLWAAAFLAFDWLQTLCCVLVNRERS